MADPLDIQATRIANIVNVLRKKDLSFLFNDTPDLSEREERYKKTLELYMDDYFPEFKKTFEGAGWVPPNISGVAIATLDKKGEGKGVKKPPLWGIDDSKRLINQFIMETGTDPNSLTKEQKVLYAELLFRNFEFNEITREVDIVADPMYPGSSMINQAIIPDDPKFPDNVYIVESKYQEMAWNNGATALLDGNLLAQSLYAAAANGFIGNNPDHGNSIVNGIVSGMSDDTLLEGESLDNNYLINWLNSWIENKSRIRSYLSDGIIRDSNNVPVDNNIVKGWSLNAPVQDKLNVLLQYYQEHPSMIIDGDSLVPQYGNTYTDNRRREIQLAMGRWGWDGTKSIRDNVNNILKSNNRDPSDQLIYDTSGKRYSARHTRDAIVTAAENFMNRSLYKDEPGSDGYENEVVEFLMGIDQFGGSTFAGFDEKQATTFARLEAADWNLNTNTGLDAAVESILDHNLFSKDDITEDAFEAIKDAINEMEYPNLADALGDPRLTNVIDGHVNFKNEKDAAEEDADTYYQTNTPNALQLTIKSIMRQNGLIGPGTSQGFQQHLDSYTIPEIARRIFNAGGAADQDEVREFVERFTGRDDIARSRSSGETSLNWSDVYENDYNRQYNPSRPPGVPGMGEFTENKPWEVYPGVYDLFDEEGKPMAPPEIDVPEMSMRLKGLALTRPEWSQFLALKMSDPEYAKEFKAAAQAKIDAGRYHQETEGMGNLWSEQNKKIDEMRTEMDEGLEIARDDYAAGVEALPPVDEGPFTIYPENPPPLGLETDIKRRAEIHAGFSEADIQKKIEERDRTIKVLRGIQQNAADFRTVTPGLTQEEFFESRLGGFESEFEGTEFAAAERQRQEKITERDAERERLQAERERRQLLQAGTGRGSGLGMAVFERGRRERGRR